MRLPMLVEWSLGSLERYRWDGLRLMPDARPPRASPVNYGLVPHYFNPADQDYLDAIWASRQAVAAGSWLEGEVLGLLYLADGDHKVILGEGRLELDWEGIWAWFAGREVQLLEASEAAALVRSLPSPPGPKR